MLTRRDALVMGVGATAAAGVPVAATTAQAAALACESVLPFRPVPDHVSEATQTVLSYAEAWVAAGHTLAELPWPDREEPPGVSWEATRALRGTSAGIVVLCPCTNAAPDPEIAWQRPAGLPDPVSWMLYGGMQNRLLPQLARWLGELPSGAVHNPRLGWVAGLSGAPAIVHFPPVSHSRFPDEFDTVAQCRYVLAVTAAVHAAICRLAETYESVQYGQVEYLMQPDDVGLTSNGTHRMLVRLGAPRQTVV